MKISCIAVLTVLRIFVFSLACLLCGSAFAYAAEEEAGQQPISIEANRMVSQETKNSVLFFGKVDARQGTLIIRAEEMTVFYTEKNNGKTTQPSTLSGKLSAKQSAHQASNQTTNQVTDTPTSQVEKLICTHDVKITQGDWLGTGDRMEYFAKERKAILSGNAKAWQGQNMVAGKTIIYYLDEKRSVVEPDASSNGRVKAIIHPNTKK